MNKNIVPVKYVPANTQRPKYFLGAVLGVAQLGFSVYNMIKQNEAQKKMVAEQNDMIEKNNNLSFQTRIDSEKNSANNYARNTPLTSFYAKGGKVEQPYVSGLDRLKQSFVDTYAPIKTIFQPAPVLHFGGGDTNGSGATSSWGDDIRSGHKTYETPNYVGTEDFNTAFDKARKAGLSEFTFNNKKYTTEMGNDPNNNTAGAKRVQVTSVIKGKTRLINNNTRSGTKNDTINTMYPIELMPILENRKYAIGGTNVQQTTEDMSIAYGPTHEQGGVPIGNIEVEGGGGNKPGEVIKQESDGSQFIFSDRLPVPGTNMSFAQIAQQLTLAKANLEQQIGAKLKNIDSLSVDLNKAPSIPKANTQAHKISINKKNINSLEDNIKNIDAQIEELKQTQLEFGKQQGLYNEDGTPKNTDNPNIPHMAVGGKTIIKDGKYYWQDNNGSLSILDENKFNLDGTLKTNVAEFDNNIIGPFKTSLDINKITENANASLQKGLSNNVFDKNVQLPEVPSFGTKLQTFGAKADNFMQSNTGQAAMGLATTVVNYIANKNTARNMAALKTPDYIPIKTNDVQTVDLEATRKDIRDSEASIARFAKDNYANPNVALAASQNARNNSIDKLGQVNQQEAQINTNIRASNLDRRMRIDAINAENTAKNNELKLNKSMSDINNSQAVTAGLTSDLNKVITNYKQGVVEDKTINLYSKLNPKGVNDTIDLELKYGVDRNELLKLGSDEEKLNYLTNVKGLSIKDAQSYVYKIKPFNNINYGGISINK